MNETLDPRYRLPRHVVPQSYRLRLEPDLDALRFTGTVAIDVDVTEPCSEIELNSLELEIGDARIDRPDGRSLVATVTIDKERERAALALPETLGVGAATIHVAFAGELNDLLVGFYRSTFTDEDGAERTIATSQLAATDARRAFPCFDEPSLKATFDVTLVVAEGLSAFSNSPVAAEQVLADGRREIRFSPTMKMSTYLVAFVVGPLESSEPTDVDGVPLSVVCRPGQLERAGFAAEVGAFALRFYADYFAIPYPGDKVDLVAIPDFAYGAMENLGCVTFRETTMLVDPGTASTKDLQNVALVVAHELAHMWFGDLVTMQWWEGIWLNEAFATFLEYVCVDAFRPEWKVWVQFGAEREAGLAIDALHSTRPIEFPVHSPSDAMAMIDTITYQKGGSVLRMLEQYLGADVYRDGIRRYLRTHAYANTVTKDLWAALEAESGEPVGQIMDTWILQGGHPTVSVDGGVMRQAPFTYGPARGSSAIGSSWRVPVRSRTVGTDETAAQLLDDAPLAVAAGTPAIVNAGGSGVYRTSYEPSSLAAIASSLDQLSEVERAVLLGDTRALAVAGERTVHDVLTLAAALGTSVEPFVWEMVGEFLVRLDRFIDDADRPALRTATTALFGPLLAELGWTRRDGEDERARQVRATAVLELGRLAEDAEVRDEALRRFTADELDGDLADSIIGVVASMARPEDFEVMVRRFKAAKDPQIEDRYRTGIATFSSKALAVATFAECFELFRSQDAPRVIAQLVSTRAGGRDVWEALSSSWEETVPRIPSLMQSALGAGVVAFTSDRAFAERVAAFHRANPIQTGQRRVEQSLERMLIGVDFAERARPGLGDALRSIRP